MNADRSDFLDELHARDPRPCSGRRGASIRSRTAQRSRSRRRPDAAPTVPRPFGLVAELTYGCPLHCPYCSNPTHYPPNDQELSTEDWRRVFAEAASIGVLHAAPLRGRAAAPPGLARADCRRACGRALHESDHQRRRADLARGSPSSRPPASTACRSASRPTRRVWPTVSPARPRMPRSSGPPGWCVQLGLAADDQRGDPPSQHRSYRSGDRPRGGPRCAPPRAGERPVLRLGVPEPGCAAAACASK